MRARLTCHVKNRTCNNLFGNVFHAEAYSKQKCCLRRLSPVSRPRSSGGRSWLLAVGKGRAGVNVHRVARVDMGSWYECVCTYYWQPRVRHHHRRQPFIAGKPIHPPFSAEEPPAREIFHRRVTDLHETDLLSAVGHGLAIRSAKNFLIMKKVSLPRRMCGAALSMPRLGADVLVSNHRGCRILCLFNKQWCFYLATKFHASITMCWINVNLDSQSVISRSVLYTVMYRVTTVTRNYTWQYNNDTRAMLSCNFHLSVSSSNK